MTDANYIRHLKALGKFCKAYDVAGTNVTADQLLLATTADQIATGLTVDNPAVLLYAGIASQWSGNITNGGTAIKATMISAATSYLTLSIFTSSLTTVPASSTVAAVLTAFATEMTSVDNKTLTTKASTGLVNFFDTISGLTGSWNTAAPGDYPDVTYVVETIV